LTSQDSFQAAFKELYDQKKITYMNIFDPDGNLYWTSQHGVYEDGYKLLSTWSSLPASITVWSRRYMVLLNNHPKYLLATSLRKEGIVVLCRTASNYYFLVLSPSGWEPTEILDVVWRLSRLF